MSGNTKIIVSVVAVVAIGAGVYIAYKKKPEWFSGILSSPNQGNPAIGAAPTQDKTAQRISAGSAALGSLTKAYSDILG